MNLKEQITADIKTAMKANAKGGQAGEAEKLTVLRGVSSALKNAEIAKQMKQGASAALTDEEMLAVVTTEAKKRRDSIAAFTATRPELAEAEQKELAMLQVYLPAQMSAAEIEKAIVAIIAETGSKEFNVVVKVAMAQLKGRADGKLITEIIKKKLGE